MTKRAIGLLAAALLCGCSAVYTTTPVGQTPLDIEQDKAVWEGNWIAGDGSLAIAVTDGSNGVLEVGWIESNGGKLTFEAREALLRTFGATTFVSMKDSKDTEEGRYLWGWIKRQSERVILVWTPRPEAFRELVQAGGLPGVTNGNSITLSGLNSNHLALIASSTNGLLRKWEEPLVLFKPWR